MQFGTDLGLRVHKMLMEFSSTSLKLCILRRHLLCVAHTWESKPQNEARKGKKCALKNHKHGNLDECLIYANYSLFS